MAPIHAAYMKRDRQRVEGILPPTFRTKLVVGAFQERFKGQTFRGLAGQGLILAFLVSEALPITMTSTVHLWAHPVRHQTMVPHSVRNDNPFYGQGRSLC
jgi:hypothetical protein